MKVYWTDTAQAHLKSIYTHIALDSEIFAKRTIDRLTRRSQQIAAFPFSGRRVHEYDMEQIREVIEGAYRIIYHITPERVDIIAVIHCAMPMLDE